MLLFLSKKVYWFVRNIKLQYANEGFSHQARMMENAVVESFFFFICLFLPLLVCFLPLLLVQPESAPTAESAAL